jgi:hypothetical protein
MLALQWCSTNVSCSSRLRHSQEVGRSQAGANLLGHMGCLFGGLAFVGIQLHEHHHKLITAQTGHSVHFAHAGTQALGHLDQ